MESKSRWKRLGNNMKLRKKMQIDFSRNWLKIWSKCRYRNRRKNRKIIRIWFKVFRRRRWIFRERNRPSIKSIWGWKCKIFKYINIYYFSFVNIYVKILGIMSRKRKNYRLWRHSSKKNRNRKIYYSKNWWMRKRRSKKKGKS